MSSLTKEIKNVLEKDIPTGFVCRMFCTNCKSVHLLDRSAMLVVVFAIDEMRGMERNEEVDWSSHYIETNFCVDCDSTQESVAIKKIV